MPVAAPQAAAMPARGDAIRQDEQHARTGYELHDERGRDEGDKQLSTHLTHPHA